MLTFGLSAAIFGLAAWLVQGDLYSAVSDLEALLKSEEGAMDIVQRYLKTEYSRLDALKRQVTVVVVVGPRF